MQIPKFIKRDVKPQLRGVASKYLDLFITPNVFGDLFNEDEELIALNSVELVATMIEQELKGRNRSWLLQDRLMGKYLQLTKEQYRNDLIEAIASGLREDS